MATAFFDVDGTILRGAAGLLALDIFRKAGYITYWHAVQAAGYHVLHKAGVMQADEVYKKAIAPFVGRPETEVAELLERVYRQRVRPAIYERAVSLAEAHQRRGDRVVLLSASSSLLLEHFRDALPVTDVLAFTQLAADGVYINDYEEPVPYGDNKLLLASRYVEKHGERLADATFYTDSITDLALLERVGVPRPVNADLRLTRVAEKNGWPALRLYRVIGPQ
jgi:putative phosphoserine phosphatase / 1-acylglycerol-3-phosphate O-acyltransferase